MATNVIEKITRHYVPSDGNIQHNDPFLSPHKNPESDQASRSNCQLIGPVGIEECVKRHYCWGMVYKIQNVGNSERQMAHFPRVARHEK